MKAAILLTGMSAPSLLASASPQGAAPASPPAPCVGYSVSGAGTPAVDGCYVQQQQHFVLDGGHELYAYNGAWRLGLSGRNVSYVALAPSAWPPESDGGCGAVWGQQSGGDPCPSVRRSNLPPSPAPPPTAPPSPPPAPLPPPSSMRLVWSDDFDGAALNESRWNVLEQVHRGGVYTRGNVLLRDGALVLRTVAQNLTIEQGGVPTPFYVSSGAVNTSGLAQQRGGRWEARVRLPAVARSAGYTLHSSIWLTAERGRPGNSGCPQEIDVVEQYARAKAPASSAAANLHPFRGTAATSCAKVGSKPLPGGTTATGDWSGNWTTFTVDWTEEWIAMRVNGVPFASWNDAAAVATFTDEQFLALTACVMERKPPTAVDSFPLEFAIDYVKVYEFV
jgi:hypothetical protein